MQKKNLQAIGKKMISSALIFIIIFTLLRALFIRKTYAAQVRNIDSNNIYNINENLYPGYATLLQNLKSTHPNWTFTLLYTDLEWIDVLINETTAKHNRSLVQGKTGEWLCTYSECDGKPYDGKDWFGASQTAVAYYMDPRNFLTEDRIFQFETLSYIPSIHNEAGVEAVLKGTFMSNKRICDYYGKSEYGTKTFAQAIMSAAQSSGVSPYHLASRIRQEVGANGSGSITGKVSGYEGYYNFYNIGAYASSDPVINGLIYAKNSNQNWNTPEKAILGGANWIASSYISKGQDSLYLQKWDVDSKNGLYGHQYMQNIQAPTSEASTIYSSYKKIFNNDLSGTSFNFIIPMYKNISKTISRYPSNSTYVSQDAEIYDATGWGVHIRQTPAGTSLGVKDGGYSFIRIELKASKAGGNTWDKVMLSDGTMAYVATQYIIEKSNKNQVSKKAYINSATSLMNAPRTVANGATEIRLLYQGQSATIIEEGKYKFDGYTWTKVRLTDGTEGYIPNQFVTNGSYGEEVRITCNTELALRTGAGTGNSIMKYIDPGVVVTRIETATTQVNGYYWDKVITADGAVGYMARERYNPYSLWLTPVNAGTTTNQPVLEVPSVKVEINETDKVIKAIPQGTLADIKGKYPQAKLVSGSENLGTGSKISIDGKEFVIIKLGDVNGDSTVDIIDLALIKRHLIGSKELKNEYMKAGILQSGNNECNIIDLALLKRFLSGMQNIEL